MDDATQKLVDEARRYAKFDGEFGFFRVKPLLVEMADALEAAQRPPVSPEVDRLRARVRELEAQRADVLAEVQALEHSDWLRDTIAGDRLRAALTDGAPSDTERNES